MLYGLIELPWWGYALVVLGTMHFTLIATTLYLHRHQTHRAIDLHPAVAHVFRFWLWLTCGMRTRDWVAIHRKHHACADMPDDPHSPLNHGIRKMLVQGYEVYCAAADDHDTIRRYGHGTPDDWLEHHVYRHNNAGVRLLFVIDIILFGVPGIVVVAFQQMWIPFFAAGVINGAGHYWGYRNFEVADASTNIVPWGVLIAGEELHNNHHAFPGSARFSVKPWEFDIGWLYIRLLAAMGLARVKKVTPPLVRRPDKIDIDLDTVRAVIAHRVPLMTEYSREVLGGVHRQELRKSDISRTEQLRRIKKLLVRDPERLDADTRQLLERTLAQCRPLDVAYQFKLRLCALWNERDASYESLQTDLEGWCRQASASGIPALQDFARTLPQYSLQAM